MKHDIVWLFGFAGSGKSTIARELGNRFNAVVVDSDVFRYAWPDLGWHPHDKKTRAARLLAVAKDIASEGKRVVVACITPYKASRDVVAKHAFLVRVHTPIDVCRKRKFDLYEHSNLLAGKDAEFQEGEAFNVRGDGPLGVASTTIATMVGWL